MPTRPNNRKKRGRQGVVEDLLERLPSVGLFLLLSILTGTMFFSQKGLPLYFDMREARQSLQHQIRQLELVNAAVEADILRIQTDEFRLEELARNRLGMVRPGEKVYQFVEPAPSPITARP
jgi:cell division protein FtsB